MTYKEIGEHINLSPKRCAEIVRKIFRISRAQESRQDYRAFDRDVIRGKLICSLKDEYLKKVSVVSVLWCTDIVKVRTEIETLLKSKKS
jgi:hypothetical protein